MEDLYPHFVALEKLVITKGIQKLKKKEMITQIQKTSPETATLIHLLIAVKKFNKKEIKILTTMMRNQLDEHGIYFKVTSPDPLTEKSVINILQKIYPAPVIEQVSSQKIGIKIEGEGLAYQRNLEQDLEKIFTL